MTRQNLFIKKCKDLANVSNLIQKANRSKSWPFKWKIYAMTTRNIELIQVDR